MLYNLVNITHTHTRSHAHTNYPLANMASKFDDTIYASNLASEIGRTLAKLKTLKEIQKNLCVQDDQHGPPTHAQSVKQDLVDRLLSEKRKADEALQTATKEFNLACTKEMPADPYSVKRREWRENQDVSEFAKLSAAEHLYSVTENLKFEQSKLFRLQYNLDNVPGMRHYFENKFRPYYMSKYVA